MEVYVAGTIRFEAEAIHPKALERLRLDLSFANPEYVKRKRLRRSTEGIPTRIECLTEDRFGHVEIPRGAVATFRQRCAEVGIPVSFVDRRVLLPRQEFRADIELRPYQKQAVLTMRAGVQGYVVAPCGAGKSVLAAGLIAELDQPTLILVHTRELLDQWRALIERIFGIEPGIVSAGRFQTAPITIATVQSLIKNPRFSILSPRFGCVIVDEVHHSVCSTFQIVVPQFAAHYRYGLTATPFREDGKTPLIGWTFGKKLYEIEHTELLDHRHLIKPRVGILYSDFKIEIDEETEKYDHAKCIDLLVNDEERNNLIAILAYAEAQAGHSVLILSSRIDHCTRLAQMIRERDVDAEVLVGTMGKTKRRRILDDFKKGTVRVVVATTLADEGMDVPRILAFPGRGRGRTQQRLGRLMRPHPSKRDAVLYDIVDANVPVLLRQYQTRKRVYRSLGIEPVESPIFGSQEGSHETD
jgi:superfamily II DNA or RNA helicase